MKLDRFFMNRLLEWTILLILIGKKRCVCIFPLDSVSKNIRIAAVPAVLKALFAVSFGLK